jgi:hypothetical protein
MSTCEHFQPYYDSSGSERDEICMPTRDDDVYGTLDLFDGDESEMMIDVPGQCAVPGRERVIVTRNCVTQLCSMGGAGCERLQKYDQAVEDALIMAGLLPGMD